MKLLKIIVALIIVLILFSLLSYGMTATDSFDWVMLNPFEAIAGIVFTLSFGFGFPVWLASLLIMLLFLLCWYGFYLVIDRLFFKDNKES